ncbi:MAG: hypothetical protein Q8Q86_01745 [Candidatus Daviesbacteria bacterium]|nr:hypothetical protein [Candidatus Daviesbacteria bacterium]
MTKAILHGFLAGVALLSVYFLVMGFASGSWDYTVRQLVSLRYWITALILGFSIQVGLFSYLKNCHKETKLEQGAVAAGTGTSSLAMLACCAHHLTDILPLLGLSAVSLVLARYQIWFLSLGILSNLVGIFLMGRQVWRMQR